MTFTPCLVETAYPPGRPGGVIRVANVGRGYGDTWLVRDGLRYLGVVTRWGPREWSFQAQQRDGTLSALLHEGSSRREALDRAGLGA